MTTSALPKSWSAMFCRGPTAAPSVMLPAVTGVGHVLHVAGPPLRRRCIQVIHVVDDFCFLEVPLRSDSSVGDVKFRKDGTTIGRHPCTTGLPSLRCSATHAAGRRHRQASLGRQAGSWLIPALWLRGLLAIAVLLMDRPRQSMGGCLPLAARLLAASFLPPPTANMTTLAFWVP